MFIPLMKADAVQRLVYGSFDETPDRAREVCDYATAKAAFQSWSDGMFKASGGKSLGNIRGQHNGKIAAGKLVDITFDDEAKRVDFVAKIIDDNEWQKVDEGVYTGFSPGGNYAKRWQDGAYRRYTPSVGELSIVDVPCNPSATFTMVKADGVEEQVEFTLAKAYEPGNEATLDRADALAKAAGKPRNDFVAKARAELIAENADAALAKMAEPEAEKKPDVATALEAALAKADQITSTAALDTSLPEPFRDFAKAAAAMRALVADDTLAKGLWQVRSAASLLQELSCLQCDAAYEAKSENDGSTVPGDLAEVVKRMGQIVVSMAQEEVAELIAQMPEADPIVVVIDDPETMELAASIVDLVKADTALMEKAGKRNSAKDQKTVQEMHDHSVALGATCDAEANKDALSAMTGDRDRLAKAVEASVPKVEALTDKLEKMAAERDEDRDRLAKALGEIEALKAKAEPAKGVLIVHEKGDDGKPMGKAAEAVLDTVPAGRERTAAIETEARRILATR